MSKAPKQRRSVSVETRQLRAVNFDAEMGIYGMKRLSPYNTFDHHVILECSRGHIWETTPQNINVKQEYQKANDKSAWDMCPDCAHDIKNTKRANANILYARQRGFQILNADRNVGKWKYICESCGTHLKSAPNQALDLWSKCSGCDDGDISDNGNTVWCADDGVHAVLWIGREPEYVRIGGLDVYPVWGEFIGKSFVGEEGVMINANIIKLLKSPARSKAVQLLALAKDEIERRNNVIVITADRHGNHMPPLNKLEHSPLTRELLHELQINSNFWASEPTPIHIDVPEILEDMTPPLVIPEELVLKLPEEYKNNKSFLRLFGKSIDGDYGEAANLAAAMTTNTFPLMERDGELYKFTYTHPLRRNVVGRWSAIKAHAILDAALAAFSTFGDGRVYKTNS